MPDQLTSQRDGVSGADRAPNAKPPSNWIASSILFAVVALAPLPFGSVDPIPVVVWCMALGVALAAVSLRALDKRHLWMIAAAAMIVAAYVAVLHEQMAIRPLFPISKPDPIWQQAGDALGAQLPGLVSVVGSQPLLALGAPLALMLCLLTSLVVCVDRKRAHQLLYVVASSGAAYAIYGILAFLVDPGRVLWMKKEAYFNNLTATFINRNTAAVYFGCCAILWLLIVVDRVRKHATSQTALSLSTLLRTKGIAPRRLLAEIGAFISCLVAMFLTGSRAGVLLSLLAGVAALALLLKNTMARVQRPVRIVVVASAALILVIQIFGAGVLERFDVEGFDSGGRVESYGSTMAMIRDHPWLGTGQGTFAWAYPAYRGNSYTSWGVWERAHSTPLEIASEMGLPLASLVIVAWAGIFAVLISGFRRRARDRIIVIAAIATASVAILHSLIDFSLQIPGFAIVVFAVLGAGLAQSFPSRRPPPLPIPPGSTPRNDVAEGLIPA